MGAKFQVGTEGEEADAMPAFHELKPSEWKQSQGGSNSFLGDSGRSQRIGSR